MGLRYFIQHSSSPFAAVARVIYRGLRNFSIPSIPFLFKPLLSIYIAIRTLVYTLRRVFWAEPMFKAYCSKLGKNVHTGIFLHWVMGSGKIEIDDNTTIDGKCAIMFTTAYRPDPTLRIGKNVWVGNLSSFTIGDRIEIGDHVLIAGGCTFLDASGHPTDPDLRRAKYPAPRDRVRPIKIARDAWIGQGSIILPGTTIGEGAVISAHSVVRGTVEPFTIVAGNPAKPVGQVNRSVPAEIDTPEISTADSSASA